MRNTANLLRASAACCGLLLAVPGAALAQDSGSSHIELGHGLGKATSVCRHLSRTEAAGHGRLSTLSASALATLRSDCASLAAAETAAAPALHSAAQAARTSLQGLEMSVGAACQSNSSSDGASPTAPRDMRSSAHPPVSAGCLAALQSARAARQQALSTYRQAVRTALAPVAAAASTVAGDLTADGLSGGSHRSGDRHPSTPMSTGSGASPGQTGDNAHHGAHDGGPALSGGREPAGQAGHN